MGSRLGPSHEQWSDCEFDFRPAAVGMLGIQHTKRGLGIVTLGPGLPGPDTTSMGLPVRTAAPDRPPWHHPWPDQHKLAVPCVVSGWGTQLG